MINQKLTKIFFEFVQNFKNSRNYKLIMKKSQKKKNLEQEIKYKKLKIYL